VIVDYEVDFPTATSYELGLYSSGLQLFPQVVLGKNFAWGRLRRAGVVDISVFDYEEILDIFASRCLTSGFISHMSTTMDDLIGPLGKACDALGETLAAGNLPQPKMLQNATDLVERLMAFHVLNWVLPIEEILTRLRRIVGTHAAAREALLSLIVPFTSSHLLDGVGPNGQSDNARRAGLRGNGNAQRLAHRTLSIWLQSRGDPSDLAFLTNLAHLGRLVAEEEEQRRRIQNKWMTIASTLAPELLHPKNGDLDVNYTPVAILPENDNIWEWLNHD
jgi:hypothetical protein